MACNDILLVILAVIVFAGILLYLSKCDGKPILNEGTLDPEYDPYRSVSQDSVLGSYTPAYKRNKQLGEEFEFKKKRFVKRSREDIDKAFDVNELLPQEFEDDFFDIEPLQAKRLDDANLIHPIKHMGTDSRGASLKNASRDPRGDIPIPKMEVGPFLQSDIDPDNNIRPYYGCCKA